MARPFMFAALCQRAHPLKHSLAESIFVSRVRKTAKKISLAEKFVSRVTRKPRYQCIWIYKRSFHQKFFQLRRDIYLYLLQYFPLILGVISIKWPIIYKENPCYDVCTCLYQHVKERGKNLYISLYSQQSIDPRPFLTTETELVSTGIVFRALSIFQIKPRRSIVIKTILIMKNFNKI